MEDPAMSKGRREETIVLETEACEVGRGRLLTPPQNKREYEKDWSKQDQLGMRWWKKDHEWRCWWESSHRW
jgi:hypothetical protein